MAVVVWLAGKVCPQKLFSSQLPTSAEIALHVPFLKNRVSATGGAKSPIS